MESEKEINREGEIDLIELVKFIWSKRLFITKITSVFVAFGLLIAFTTPKEYETSCILIPEAMDGGSGLGGSLGGLAALAGVDLGGMSGGGSTINPGLYRSVAQSTPFLLELINQEFYFQELDLKVSLFDYYMKYQKVGLISKVISFPFYVIGWFSSQDEELMFIEGDASQILSLSKNQENAVESLKERILVTMDWELSVVTIDVEMQDPRVAAEVARFTQTYITDYVENYSVSKSREQLRFVEEQFNQRKEEFEKVQLELAIFRDQNQYVTTSRARSEEERLQSKYNLAFSIYNQLAQQVEKIKLQINEDTPVFTVLEPVKVPVAKSQPNRALILVISVFLGVIAGSSSVLFGVFIRF